VRLRFLLLAKEAKLLEELLGPNAYGFETLTELAILPLEGRSACLSSAGGDGLHLRLGLVGATPPARHFVGKCLDQVFELLECDQVRSFAV
jgi:hypothetical protein